MNKFKVSAVICAAGLSSRMAPENKLLLPFRGKPLIYHTVMQVLSSEVDEVIVVLGNEYDKVLKELAPVQHQIITAFNKDFRSGQTSSIKVGLNRMDKESKAVMICLADMPLLTGLHYNQLLQCYGRHSSGKDNLICRPMVLSRPGHPVS